MKKIALGIFCAICAVCQIKADVFTHTFRFSESDFGIANSYGDSLVISSLSCASVYPDVTDPGIPMVSRSIALPQGVSAGDYSVTFSKRLIRSGVDLKNAPKPIPTDMPAEKMWVSPGRYYQKVYPDSNCVRTITYQMGGVNVLGFIMTPFVFDASEHNLYFVDSIRVDINVTSQSMRKAPVKVRPQQMEALQAVVDNVESLADISVLNPLEENGNEYVEYIIITNENLKSSFQPLADWKRKKGVPTEIITVEEIDNAYPQETQQMRIKACIKDYYENNFTQFVLLGGDVDIVPTIHCYISKTYATANIPSDIYYSCIEDLDWDANKNGIFGETKYDKMSIIPVVNIARAPARTTTDVDIFVNRTLEYEKNPICLWQFLQAGTYLDLGIYGEQLAKKLFNSVIAYKVILGSNLFFDSYTYSGEIFGSTTFNNELKKGYQFTEIISHGLSNGWIDSYDRNPYFNCQMASTLENNGHTLLTTMACKTNWFDLEESKFKSNPCLSESFFRNPKSGIIGYLGSSREGWFNNALDYSMAYERNFYERLLNSNGETQPYEKNFGALVSHVKRSFMNLCYDDDTYRWLHYSINAIGDPEMPIYNSVPGEIDNASTDFDNEGNLTVNTGLKDTRVCVSSADNGDYYEVQRGKELTFQIGEKGKYDIWITKQSYKPKHFIRSYNGKPVELDSSDIKPIPTQIVSMSPNPATSKVTILYNVLASLSNPKVQFAFTNINGFPTYTHDVSEPGTKVTFDIGYFQSGTYIVNLIVNGIKTEANSKLIKQ